MPALPAAHMHIFETIASMEYSNRSAKINMVPPAVLAVFLVTFARAETLQKVIFPDDVAANRAAFCLDGTNAGYYISENPNSTGWAIYLEGGGLCVTVFDCESRVKGSQGSSSFWGEVHNDNNNVCSSTEEGNPFGEFNKVYVPYCSGDTWTGTTIRNEALGGLHTCGHNIVGTVIEHLYNTTKFSSATHLLLSGGSAGGIGVFHNADYVSNLIHNVKVKLIINHQIHVWEPLLNEHIAH